MITGIRPSAGFTLIELMVTLAVVVTLTLLAIPSFVAFNQRQAVRGAADEVLSAWNDARFEAAKRNTNVKFGYIVNGSTFCVGAATTTNANDTTPCDCTTAAPADATLTCNVSRFPNDQSEWNGVTLNGGTTLGGANHVVVLDLKQLRLVSSAGAGAISLDDPAGSKAYRMNVRIDKFGRGVVCQSNAAGLAEVTGFNFRKCSP
jgi:type IV fimbrial biogenesis protein FimT